MRRYETIFIIDPDLAEPARNERLDKVKEIISDYKGEIIQFDEWGNRKLAYEIKKKTRGYYTLVDYCGDGPLVDELQRTFRLDDKFMKFITIILDDNADPEQVKVSIANAKAEAEASKAAAEAEDGEDTEETTDTSIEEE
jgi:small subunit ribosomal protein S6